MICEESKNTTCPRSLTGRDGPCADTVGLSAKYDEEGKGITVSRYDACEPPDVEPFDVVTALERGEFDKLS